MMQYILQMWLHCVNSSCLLDAHMMVALQRLWQAVEAVLCCRAGAVDICMYIDVYRYMYAVWQQHAAVYIAFLYSSWYI